LLQNICIFNFFHRLRLYINSFKYIEGKRTSYFRVMVVVLFSSAKDDKYY
jgi:hypothetical protein